MNFFWIWNKSLNPKILQKAFEIFIHALQFPNKSNFCFQCPQELENEEREDDYNDVEYSIVEGIQMGCQTNEVKGQLPRQIFEEDTAGDNLVEGVEVKNQTCLNSKSKQDAISDLMNNLENRNMIKRTIKALESTAQDDMTMKIISLLKRLAGKCKILPQGYRRFFDEIKLDTPISALLTTCTSYRKLYSLFYKYLKKELYFFGDAKKLKIL